MGEWESGKEGKREKAAYARRKVHALKPEDRSAYMCGSTKGPLKQAQHTISIVETRCIRCVLG